MAHKSGLYLAVTPVDLDPFRYVYTVVTDTESEK